LKDDLHRRVGGCERNFDVAINGIDVGDEAEIGASLVGREWIRLRHVGRIPVVVAERLVKNLVRALRRGNAHIEIVSGA
jgi:predicted acyltransferase (DUF342 family)